MKIPNFKNKKWLGILAGTVLTVFVGVQATVAFLATGTEPIVNVFKPYEYKQGQFSLSKTLMHPFGANYEIPDDIAFQFKLKFEAKSGTESALGFRTTGSAYRYRTTGSSIMSTGSAYELRSTTPNAYAGYVFDTTYGKYTANENGEFIITLKPGDRVDVQGVDEGTTVTVTELPTDLPGFYVKDNMDTKQLTISADEFGVIQFINVYDPDYDDITADYDVYIDKTLNGRDMKAGDSFKFIMEYRDHATGQWHPFASTYVVDKLYKNEPDAIFSEYNGLSDFEFDAPGIYEFRVSEYIPEDSDKLPNMTYDTTKSIFTVSVVDDDMSGTLKVQKVMPSTDSLDTVKVDHENKEVIVSFTNTYTKPSGPGGGGGIIKPTEPTENPKVPAQLNGGSHFAYVGGYPDATVQPNGNITRAEVSAIFYRLLKDEVKAEYTCGTNIFPDVNAGDWFNVDVSTMANLNVLGGYPDGTFKPNSPITRAEFVAIITKFVDYSIADPDRFPDISGHWAEEAILEAAAAGWVGGYEDGTFRPENNLTRAEAMVIVNKILCRTPLSVDDLLDGMINWPDNADPTAWYYVDVQEATNGHEYEWLDKEQTHEHWTQLDNKEEKQSFLIRLLHLFRGKG